MHEAFLELLAVEGDSKSVHLVLDVRQKFEDIGVYLDLHGFWREAE